jgi:alkanesulfonate monooxygenase SsuD/methylene tetrahydromethanopterin reductase-like flavin-dependent oxidoreductase (luciferase family)
MARFRVGVQLHPQHTTTDALRDAWRAADAMGVDSIWVWDHSFPLHGDPDGAHFEGWTLLAVMAVDVAEHADAWNAFGPPDSYAHKNRVLDEWCARVGRDPATIERTVGLMSPAELDQADEFLAAGATDLIVGVGHPFDLDGVARLLDAARA